MSPGTKNTTTNKADTIRPMASATGRNIREQMIARMLQLQSSSSSKPLKQPINNRVQAPIIGPNPRIRGNEISPKKFLKMITETFGS